MKITCGFKTNKIYTFCFFIKVLDQLQERKKKKSLLLLLFCLRILLNIYRLSIYYAFCSSQKLRFRSQFSPALPSNRKSKKEKLQHLFPFVRHGLQGHQLPWGESSYEEDAVEEISDVPFYSDSRSLSKKMTVLLVVLSQLCPLTG